MASESGLFFNAEAHLPVENLSLVAVAVAVTTVVAVAVWTVS